MYKNLVWLLHLGPGVQRSDWGLMFYRSYTVQYKGKEEEIKERAVRIRQNILINIIYIYKKKPIVVLYTNPVNPEQLLCKRISAVFSFST